MTALGRVLGLGALPLALTAALCSVTIRGAVVPMLASVPSAHASCTQPPTFVPGYQRQPGYVVARGRGFWFDSDAWVEGIVCTAGTLTITADGDLAGNDLPRLTVVLDQEVLAEPAFDRTRTVSVRIPHPGTVLLGFFNDYYRADVRVASLRDVQFTGTACTGFRSVDVPFESAGKWFPETRAASLVRAQPMTLVPCGAGRLTMQVQGREGNHAFPILDVRQGGRLLKTIHTSPAWQPVALELTGTQATITVMNPYGKTLANRNLNVRDVSFVPGGPTTSP